MSNKIRKFKFKRYQLQCQIFSREVFTSSVGKIVPKRLWQGFHLLGREIVSSLLWQGFDFIDREDRFQTFSCKAFTSSTGSPMHLATVSGGIPSG